MCIANGSLQGNHGYKSMDPFLNFSASQWIFESLATYRSELFDQFAPASCVKLWVILLYHRCFENLYWKTIENTALRRTPFKYPPIYLSNNRFQIKPQQSNHSHLWKWQSSYLESGFPGRATQPFKSCKRSAALCAGKNYARSLSQIYSSWTKY